MIRNSATWLLRASIQTPGQYSYSQVLQNGMLLKSTQYAVCIGNGTMGARCATTTCSSSRSLTQTLYSLNNRLRKLLLVHTTDSSMSKSYMANYLNRARSKQIKTNRISLVQNSYKTLLNNKQPSRSYSSTESASKNEKQIEPTSKGIFQRFKEAYKKHGLILIYCHIATSCLWIVSFFHLSKSGYDISNLLNLFEKVHLITHQTSESIVNKIKTFSLRQFLIDYHIDYVLPDKALEWIGESITGTTLTHCITAIAFYKLVTPLRYLLTLGSTRVVISLFKKRGLMPAKPPPGHSIQELYTEQKYVLRRDFKRHRERYDREKARMGRLLNRHRQSRK